MFLLTSNTNDVDQSRNAMLKHFQYSKQVETNFNPYRNTLITNIRFITVIHLLVYLYDTKIHHCLGKNQ